MPMRFSGTRKHASEFYGAQNAWNGDGWTLKFRDGARFLFPEAIFEELCARCPLAMEDAEVAIASN